MAEVLRARWQPGDLTIHDCRRPYAMVFDEPHEMSFLMFPCDRLRLPPAAVEQVWSRRRPRSPGPTTSPCVTCTGCSTTRARRWPAGCGSGGWPTAVATWRTAPAQREVQLVTQNNVDIVLTTSAPETVNPVSDQCESAHHKVGGLWPSDADGTALRSAFTKALPGDGYKLTNPGAYSDGATDFTTIINKFKSSGVEIVQGCPPPRTSPRSGSRPARWGTGRGCQHRQGDPVPRRGRGPLPPRREPAHRRVVDPRHAVDVLLRRDDLPARASSRPGSRWPACPEEIARSVLYLASGDSSFVTGAAVAVDGGMHI